MTLGTLSAAAGMGPHQLERAFRSAMGISPRQYADARRMRRLKSRLKKGDDVTTALYDAGFGSSSRLYERAPSQLGMTPATYRQGGAGMQDSLHDRKFATGTIARRRDRSRDQRAVYRGRDDGRWKRRFERNIHARKSSAIEMAWKMGAEKYWRTCADASRIWICRRTCRRPHFSGAFGRSCDRFRTARRELTAKWRAPSANRRRFARWLGHAPRILSPWLCRAIAWYAKTATWQDIAGDWNEARASEARKRGQVEEKQPAKQRNRR